MRIIVAFDFKEGDSVGVEAVINDLLEELSEKTLVWRTYEPSELDLPAETKMNDLDMPLLLELILNSAVNISGNDSEDYSSNFKDMLEIDMYADKLSDILFSKIHGV